MKIGAQKYGILFVCLGLDTAGKEGCCYILLRIIRKRFMSL